MNRKKKRKMKWKPITELPSELVDEDLLLRIEKRKDNGIIYIMGYVSVEGEIYTDERFNGGFLSRDFWRNVWYVKPKKIEL